MRIIMDNGRSLQAISALNVLVAHQHIRPLEDRARKVECLRLAGFARMLANLLEAEAESIPVDIGAGH